MSTFQSYLAESLAADEAKKLGLTSVGYGLWKDKSGKVVKKTVNDQLVDVKGSRANINHYHSNVPKGKSTDHDALDQIEEILGKYETPGTKVDTDVTKYDTHKGSAIHPDKAKHLHDDLIKAGFQYYKDEDFGQHIYSKGKVRIGISGSPEVSHDGSKGKKDHYSVTYSVGHGKLKD